MMYVCMILAFPVGGSAAAVPLTTSADCARAQDAAERAERDYDAMKKEYLAQIADSGHPDASQRRALADEDVEQAKARAGAERICNRG
ncbi:hypothetical protein [Streptomyces sp. NPDC056921]|uniref:hypothetical protein n=1 Tax=Streptomyces sp. NPDC056921 TaxID=3345966 RepID=UPI003626A7F6